METNRFEDKYENEIFNMLKKFALTSRQFCDKYCIPDGLGDILLARQGSDDISNDILYSRKLSYDYDYYAFTKSTKTLHAILNLLRDKEYNFNEDVIILNRSIFENHILSRYFREHIDIENESEKIIREFVKNPIGISYDFYAKNGLGVERFNGESLGKIKMPSSYKMGEEKKYYPAFYSYLCEFAHCSFGTIECYFDGAKFYYDKKNIRLEAMLFTIFVFTKIFEGVVTVKGENFDTKKEEKKCYDLVYNSLELQNEVFNYLIEKYNTKVLDKDKLIIQLYLNEKDSPNINFSMKTMLEKLKSSLDDNEIGSVEKSKKDEYGKYIRQYPQD